MLKVRTEQLSGDVRSFYKLTGEPLNCWDQDTIRFPGEQWDVNHSLRH